MIKNARSFAIDAHGEQKYGTHPYHVHLDAVAELAREYGDTALVVAYLHDVVEDTPVPLSTIEERFGKLVADCVSIVTDEPGKSRAERKPKTYAKMAAVSGKLELALIVKAADRLANMLACVSDENDKMLNVYKKEYAVFKKAAFRKDLCFSLWYEMDQIFRASQHGGYSYLFWKDDGSRLIRQKRSYQELHHPEVVHSRGKWATGPAELLDAISGMGESPWSCGEWAVELSLQEAQELAKYLKVGLFDP